MDWAVYSLGREFYVNNAGNQIEKFGKSLEALYLQIYKCEDAVEFPEDGYHGDDIKERATQFSEEFGDRYVNVESSVRQKALVDFALPRNIAKMQADLAKYGIQYDEWFLESKLHNDGELNETI